MTMPGVSESQEGVRKKGCERKIKEQWRWGLGQGNTESIYLSRKRTQTNKMTTKTSTPHHERRKCRAEGEYVLERHESSY